MLPSWDSLGELQTFHDKLQHLGIVVGAIVGIASVVIGSGYAFTLLKVRGRVEELKAKRSDVQPVSVDTNKTPSDQSKQDVTAPAAPTVHRITPLEILDALREAPPLLRSRMENQYNGTPVAFDAELTWASEKAIFVHQIRSNSKLDYASVKIPFEMPKDNFLLGIKKGEMLHIEGVVDETNPAGADIGLQKGASIRPAAK